MVGLGVRWNVFSLRHNPSEVTSSDRYWQGECYAFDIKPEDSVCRDFSVV